MTETPTKQKPAMSRWLRVLLFVSLAANLLIVGLVAGVAMRDDHPARRATTELNDLGFGPFGRAFGEKDRREIGRAIEGRSGDIRDNGRAIRQSLENLLAALRQTPFDADEFRALVSGQQTNLEARQTIGRDIVYDRIEGMTDAERQTFAERLERQLRKRDRILKKR